MNEQVANPMDPAQAAAIDREMKAFGSDIRSFTQAMTDKADAMVDEGKRNQKENGDFPRSEGLGAVEMISENLEKVREFLI